MSEIISTSDGKISFKRSEYRCHEVRLAFSETYHEVNVWTDTWTGGRIFKYTTEVAALKISKEITQQLSNNPLSLTDN